jgi:glycosyltransferase involved in cell wall biosynthesis
MSDENSAPPASAAAPRRAGAHLAPVSVVIPTYDRCDLLAQTLERCSSCAGGVELEFVVIDDGSRDETPERLRELAKSIPNLVFRSVSNGGPGRARNLGASLASHDVVLFLGDDIQPRNDEFFRVHAELHAHHPGTDLAVLGKVVWPNRKDVDVNFVMAHVQGIGGEQFGYSDFYPYSSLDWRFFYTANVSVKRAIVRDWMREGFSDAFTLAAYEDAEFAYRMSCREAGLRILYAPLSVGSHHHPFSVGSFMERQLAAGMMGRVFADLHPSLQVRDMIGLGGIHHALGRPEDPASEAGLADAISVVEGIKSWARLIEGQLQLGSQHWHHDLLGAVFHLCYLQGFLMNTSEPGANLAAGYRFLLDEFTVRMGRVLHTELAGAAFDQRRDFRDVLKLRPLDLVRRSRLRAWARSRPWIAGPYRRLRRYL